MVKIHIQQLLPKRHSLYAVFNSSQKKFFGVFTFIMVIIHPRLTKFSTLYAKGSVVQRAKSADRINEKIFGNTVKLYNNKKKNVHAEIIEDCYNFCLPENKNILLSPLESKSDDYAGDVVILEKMKMFVGYMIDLPMSKSDKINIKSIPALMHESTHVLDYLLNPKYLVNERDLQNMTFISKFYSNKEGCSPSDLLVSDKVNKLVNLYNDVFYHLEDLNSDKSLILGNAEAKLKTCLNGIAPKVQIVLLKYMRNSMLMEQHAFKQDMHYAKILKKLGKPVDDADSKDYGKLAMFPEKIKIVEKLLVGTIKAERDKLRPQSVFQKFINNLKKRFTTKSNINV